MSKLKFGNVEENVITREEFSLTKAKDILKDEVIAILGYGIQGPAQALNLKDNGFNVIVGQREGTPSWDKAIKEGWKPGVDLFSIEEACKKATFLCNLLSDAGQIQLWDTVLKQLTKGKTLLFSHGFAVTFSDKTKVKPPKEVDVVLVAPKGSGRTVRELFFKNEGINSSYAVYQDASGHATDKVLAYGIGMGSGYLFETTFEKEVLSDLTGERGVLMGAIEGLLEAQYQVLRENGHSPSEAFNETVEELTQSIIPLMAEGGMDWMYSNASTTAQRGALDWLPRFKDATLPLFRELYQSVSSGVEAERVIAKNSDPAYKKHLDAELKEMGDREIWQAGKVVRQLRPKSGSK